MGLIEGHSGSLSPATQLPMAGFTSISSVSELKLAGITESSLYGSLTHSVSIAVVYSAGS